MLKDVVNNKDFAKLMQKHISEFIDYLFKAEKNFGILCKIDYVAFEPELPEKIQTSFVPVTMFFLAGYTYESARLDEAMLTFEAGFGEENIGSVVSVPLLSIVQIIVDETPILLNMADPIITLESSSTDDSIDEDGVQNSMASFLSNPENQKFLKK